MPSKAPRAPALALLIAAVAVLSTPALTDDVSTRGSPLGRLHIVGSDRMATQARAVGGFQAIVLRAPVRLTLRQGAHEGVELRADDNLLPQIEVRVVDRAGVPTLDIGLKPGTRVSMRGEIAATVDLIRLEGLLIRG
jgi:hypothetical protein